MSSSSVAASWASHAPRQVHTEATNGAPCLQIECLTGLVDAKVKNTTAQGKPKNFDEWIMRVMGEGIANLFMRPYNYKVRLCSGTLQGSQIVLI